jgi:hypothetical protein
MRVLYRQNLLSDLAVAEAESAEVARKYADNNVEARHARRRRKQRQRARARAFSVFHSFFSGHD